VSPASLAAMRVVAFGSSNAVTAIWKPSDQPVNAVKSSEKFGLRQDFVASSSPQLVDY
jgi:hypothetical protein